MKIEFSKSLHFYSNHGAQIFVGRHRLPVAHSDIQVQLRVGHCPSCGIFSSAGLAETLYLGRGQCSCFYGKFLQLSYSIQVLLVTAVEVLSDCLFINFFEGLAIIQHAFCWISTLLKSNKIQPDPTLLCFSRTMLPPVHPQWPEYYLCIEPWSLDLCESSFRFLTVGFCCF